MERIHKELENTLLVRLLDFTGSDANQNGGDANQNDPTQQ